MDELLFIGLVIAALVIIAPILAIVAMSRTGQLRDELFSLKNKVAELEKTIRQTNESTRLQQNIHISRLPENREELPTEEPAEKIAHSAKQAAAIARLKQAQNEALWHSSAANQLSKIESAKVEQDKSIESAISIENTPKSNNKPFQEQKHNTLSIPSDNQPEPASIFSHFFSWLSKGNPLAKIGILLLFLGIAYLLKFSIEQELISPQMRLIFSAFVCIILLVLGWKLKDKKQLYGLILQGGAIGGFYITIFAAFKLYDMAPYIVALGLMVLICIASIMLAILQRAISLAMLASIGGYAAPFLLSTGGGSHIALFSYYLMLSTAIIIISIWQSWRPLNLVGFFFTYVVAVLWGVDYYRPEYYLSCQLFLIANLIIFSLLTQLFAYKNNQNNQMLVDNLLLFSPAIISFMLQYGMTEYFYLGPAFSALGFGALYLVIGYITHKRYAAAGRHLALGNIALGAGFLTLAIPLAVSFEWTSIVWAVEGFAILWFGFQQNQKKIIIVGSLLILGSAITLLGGLNFDNWSRGSVYMVPLLIIVCVLSGALFRQYRKEDPNTEMISNAFLLVSFLVWGRWLLDITDILSWSQESEDYIIMAVVILSAYFWRVVAMRTDWMLLSLCQFLLWATGFYYLSIDFMLSEEPLGKGESSLIWPVLFGTVILFLVNSYKKVPHWLYATMHVATYWLILCLLATEIHFYVSLLPWGMTEWSFFIYIMGIVLVIFVLYWLQKSAINPMVRYKKLYWYSTLPLVALMVILSLEGNLLDGKLTFWYYIPLINPLDEAGLFSIAALVYVTRCIKALSRRPNERDQLIIKSLSAAIIVLSVCWFNGIILRALVDFEDIRWSVSSIMDSKLIQTTLSIVWTIVALIIMIFAHNRQSRINWLAGAIILAAVIAKLFLVDISNEDGLAKAISFIAVALLILIIGYFSPLPPKDQKIIERESQDVK